MCRNYVIEMNPNEAIRVEIHRFKKNLKLDIATGFNVYVISLEYFVSSLLFNISLENFYVTITVLFVLMATYVLHKKINIVE